MDRDQVNHIEELPLAELEEIQRDELCIGCGLWPCYATAPECFRYEEET